MSIQEYHFTDKMGQQQIIKYFVFCKCFCVFDQEFGHYMFKIKMEHTSFILKEKKNIRFLTNDRTSDLAFSLNASFTLQSCGFCCNRCFFKNIYLYKFYNTSVVYVIVFHWMVADNPIIKKQHYCSHDHHHSCGNQKEG